LWFDAIYINQADKDEKSGQIMLMPKIYSFATKVAVYLGQAADRSDLAIAGVTYLMPSKLLKQMQALYRFLPNS
jgi:hypothetical protein